MPNGWLAERLGMGSASYVSKSCRVRRRMGPPQRVHRYQREDSGSISAE
jgi:hypothetical protein